MKLKIIGLFTIVVIAAVLLLSSVKTGKLAGIGEGIKYTGIMCYQVNDNPPVCSPNTYTNFGMNVTRDALTGSGDVKYISVGNGSAVAAATVALDSEINECGVTSYASGTVTALLTSVGNYSIQKQYSVTCGVPLVNTTGIYNASSGNTLFAGDTISPSVSNLASGDTLTITWYIWSTG